MKRKKKRRLNATSTLPRESKKLHLSHLKLLIFFCVVTIAFTVAESTLCFAFLWIPAMMRYHESIKILFAVGGLIQGSFAVAAVWHYSRIISEFSRHPDSDKSFYWSARCMFASHWVIIVLNNVTTILGVVAYQELKEDSIRVFPYWAGVVLVFVYALYSLHTVCALQAFHAECEIKHGRGGHRRTAYLNRRGSVRVVGYNPNQPDSEEITW